MKSYEILIPFHSNKFFLMRCIESLLVTTPQNVPITIVANNENEEEINLTLNHPRIRVIKVSHSLYYPKCINYGLQFIESDNVFLIDADTYHLPGWYENITSLYETDSNIGIVGSALLEMSSNSIKDFGLSFSGYNWIQIYKGQEITSPLVRTREFQAVCTASCLINKLAFTAVGGFSEYCNISYSDIDLCIRLAQKGYRILGCAESCAYHKGNASQRIVSLLKADCFAIFMAKAFCNMKIDINKYLKESWEHFSLQYIASAQYIMLNLSSVVNYTWYKDQVEQIMNTKIIEIYEYPDTSRDATELNLVSIIRTDIYRNHFPFIYFVDLFSSVKKNQFWKRLRMADIEKDIVIDRHGTICLLSALFDEEN